MRCALLSALLACGRAARRVSRGRRKLSRLALNRCQISLCKYPAGNASGAKPLAGKVVARRLARSLCRGGGLALGDCCSEAVQDLQQLASHACEGVGRCRSRFVKH